MFYIPLKWLAARVSVKGVQTVLVDADAGDQPASFTSKRFAVVVLTKGPDGIDITQTPIIEDYNEAYRAFNTIGREISAL